LLARHDAVLVIVDVQERLAATMPRRDSVTRTSALLADVAFELGIPVLVTRQYPAGLGDVVAELAAAADRATVIDKTAFDCMREPTFVAALAATGRRQVVLAGMETHICVTQTALSLAWAGYDVHVAADAACSRRDDDRSVALDRLRAAGVTVTCSESVIYEALEEANTAEFRTVLALVKARPVAE
jgi:nicotinamidase-related amidase